MQGAMILTVLLGSLAVYAGYQFLGCWRATRESLGDRRWALLGVAWGLLTVSVVIAWWDLSEREGLISVVAAVVVGRWAASAVPLRRRASV